MTQLADLTIADGAAANQTFVVSGVNYQTNVATWLKAGASFDASIPMTFSIKIPSAKTTRTRIRVRVSIPIMDPVYTTKKIDELYADISFSIPKTATAAQKADIRAYARNMLSDNVVINAVNSNQGVY